MPRKLDDFKVGDRVALIAPFRCDGDASDIDEELDRELRLTNRTPTGLVIDINRWILVQWDGYRRSLFCNPGVLDIEAEPSDAEVNEAIRSILGHKEAQGG